MRNLLCFCATHLTTFDFLGAGEFACEFIKLIIKINLILNCNEQGWNIIILLV